MKKEFDLWEDSLKKDLSLVTIVMDRHFLLLGTYSMNLFYSGKLTWQLHIRKKIPKFTADLIEKISNPHYKMIKRNLR